MKAIIKPGDKVICVNDIFVDEITNPFVKKNLNLPLKNKSYTVKDVVKTKYGIGLRLVELENEKYYFSNVGQNLELTFDVSRFEKE